VAKNKNLPVMLIVTPDAKVPVKIRDGETAEMDGQVPVLLQDTVL
jgi:hypothetical protein